MNTFGIFTDHSNVEGAIFSYICRHPSQELLPSQFINAHSSAIRGNSDSMKRFFENAFVIKREFENFFRMRLEQDSKEDAVSAAEVDIAFQNHKLLTKYALEFIPLAKLYGDAKFEDFCAKERKEKTDSLLRSGMSNINEINKDPGIPDIMMQYAWSSDDHVTIHDKYVFSKQYLEGKKDGE